MQYITNVSNMRIILLARKPGRVISVNDDQIETEGIRSTALIIYELQQAGHEVAQLEIEFCELRGKQLFYNGQEFDVHPFEGVINRVWVDENALKAHKIQCFLEANGLYAETPALAQAILLDKASKLYTPKSLNRFKSKSFFCFKRYAYFMQ